MPFIKRNHKHQIVAIFNTMQEDGQEELPANSKEVIDFLESDELSEYSNHLLNQSDSNFIRVLEDVIDILLEKHIFLLTDLPDAAQQKLLKRKQIRREHTQSILSGEDDNIF
jgi:hypothetical protein